MNTHNCSTHSTCPSPHYLGPQTPGPFGDLKTPQRPTFFRPLVIQQNQHPVAAGQCLITTNAVIDRQRYYELQAVLSYHAQSVAAARYQAMHRAAQLTSLNVLNLRERLK